MNVRTKVRGLFLGIGIGDALGMPVESWDRARIQETYPEGLREYREPSGHKWYTGEPAGSVTDDTQLSVATARGLLATNEFDLDNQARAMIQAMRQASEGKTAAGSGVPGWGYTTVKAVRNLGNNVPVSESGKTKDPNLGHGNGVVMRQAPLAVWSIGRQAMSIRSREFHHRLVEFSSMTHYTKQSAIATLVHHHVLTTLLVSPPTRPLVGIIREQVNQCKNIWSTLKTDHLLDTQIDMWERFDKVLSNENWDADSIISEFGGGSCNVGHSLPFCYAFFLGGGDSVQVLYDVIEAGGDADSNGSIVAAMLGARHGEGVFPAHLVDGLLVKNQLLELADDCCEAFGL